jgi:hypothetical protein
MLATINGHLAAVTTKTPDQGQNFAAHQLLSVTQIQGGELQVIKIKDMDLTRKHEEGKHIQADCQVSSWQMGNRGGMSIKLDSIRPTSGKIS